MGEVSHQLGVDPGVATGIVMGLWNIVGASSCLLAGFLVDRFGANRLMIVGCILLIIPTLLFPLSGGSLKTIILLRIIQAAGLGPITSTLATLAADWFPVRQRGMVAGLQGVATSGGVLIGFLAAPGHLHPHPQLAQHHGLDGHRARHRPGLLGLRGPGPPAPCVC